MAPFNSKQLPRMQLGRGEAADIKPSFGPRQASSFFVNLRNSTVLGVMPLIGCRSLLNEGLGCPFWRADDIC